MSVDGELTTQEVQECISDLQLWAENRRAINGWASSRVMWVQLSADVLARHSEDNRRQLDDGLREANVRIMWP